MANYKAIVEHLIIGQFLSNRLPMTGQSKALIGVFILSGLMLALSLGFVMYGAYVWLDQNYPPHVTALLMGAACSFIAILAAITGWGLIEYRKRQVQRLKADILHIFETLLEVADHELAKPVNDNPKTAVALASAAGYLAGKHIA